MRVLTACAAMALPVAPAMAQNLTVQAISGSTPNLGNVAAAASGTTIFRIATGGTVSIVSGNGGNILSGTKTAATVTIQCKGGAKCTSTTAMVRIWPGTAVACRAQPVQNIAVASGSGTVGTVTVNTDGSIQFPFTGFTGNSTRTFYVGLDFPILGDNASTATSATAQWQVGVAVAPNVPTVSSQDGMATATVRRALSLVKVSDLAFGAIIPPDSGNGTVVVDAATGARSIGSGTPILLGGPASGRAEITVGGEPGTAISIAVPGALVLSRAGGGTLNASLNATASGTQTLDAAGAFSFGIGGTLGIPNETIGGDYAGSFSVNVDYN